MSVQNISAGISSSGPSPMQAIGLAANLLGNVNKNDSSTTQSAVSGNINLTVRDGETPTALSRDTENANQSVKVFDKEEYKERAEMAQVIGEISKNAVSMATYEDRQESSKLKDQAKDAENANDETKAKALYAQAADIDKRIDDKFGIGSTNGQAIAAVTAVLQALAGDNIGQAVAGGLSPYVNAKIKELTKDNDEANIAAHALWGAIEAQASGNNALAGATAAASGEITARLLTEQLYGKKPEELTASEKETISSLSQVVGALSSVAVANNSNDAYRGAEVAKSAVEHNYLFKQEAQEKAVLQQKLRDGTATEKEKEQLDEINRLDIARDEAIIKACTGSVSSEACQSLISQAQYAQFGYEQAVSYNLKVKELYPNDYQAVEAILKGKGAEEAEFEKIAINLSNSGNMSLDEAKSYLRTVKTYQAFAELVGQVYAPAALDKITTGSLPKGVSANEKLPTINQTIGHKNKETVLNGVVVKPDFYVGSAGASATLPSTAYRYMDSSKFDLLHENMTDYLSYFGFKKYDNAYQARDAFQIYYNKNDLSNSWSDAALRGEFNTLQLFNKKGEPLVRIPYEYGDKGKVLEPFTRSYPQYGIGGELQLIPKNWQNRIEIKYDNLDLLDNPNTDLILREN